MTKKARYGLLIAGFLFFLVAAPTLILYVLGKLPNLTAKKAAETGIISVTTDPRSVKVHINGEEKAEPTPTALRFLTAGSYDLKLTKEGYRTWNKTLTVLPGKVTHANPEPEKQILLKDSQPQTLRSGIKTYTLLNDSYWSLSQDGRTLLGSTIEGKNEKSFTLPVIGLELLHNDGENLLVIRHAEGIIIANDDPTSWPDSWGSAPLPQNAFNAKLTLSGQKLYYLSDNKLYALPAEANLKQANPALVLDNVISFQIFDEDIYYLSKEEATHNLYHAKLLAGNITAPQLLLGNLKDLSSPEIFMDTSRAVFLKSSDILYRVGSTLEKIADSVILVNTNGGTLVYTKPGELWWYESEANRAHIISRSQDNIRSAFFKKDLQYVFFSTDLELIAVEIRSEGGQNRYILDNGKVNFIQNQKQWLVYQKEDQLVSLDILP